MEKWMKGRSLPTASNSKEVMGKREKAVGDAFITRFPPEPNGYAHIGHAKAMHFNFSLAEKHNGHCILRYDDTNPEAESVEFIEGMKENVEWLGYDTSRTTFSSDYFDEMYDLAIKLIKKGKAYVCHHTKPEVEEQRNTCKKAQNDPKTKIIESKWRNRSVEDNLNEFQKMKMGLYDE
eukprot:UN29677